jgi:predicted helicase
MREARGVYYTPEPVVQYIVRSVDWLLRERFGLRDGLGSRERFRDENKDPNLRLAGRDRAGMRQTVMRHRVQVLDPACGTGTFLFAMVNLIRERMMARGDAGEWSDYVREDLLPRMFGFELLMAPYAVAHFKLGLQLAGGDLWDLPEEEREKWRYDFSSNERLNVFLTNTLEEAHPAGATPMFDVVGRESIEADAVKRDLPILVVMGNPPYSGHSANKGDWIRNLVEDYKKGCAELYKPAQAKWLQDDYVKFIRFGQWRIEKSGAGILAFISNNGYLENPTFRCMRQSLLETFTDIYFLDLHGNSKKKEIAPNGARDQNVFDIQQGVAIGIFVKEYGKTGNARVHHAHLWGLREENGDQDGKYPWLLSHTAVDTDWEEIIPEAPSFLFVPQSNNAKADYETGWSLPDIMNQNGDPAPGIVTTQDEFAISWDEEDAIRKVEQFLATSSEEEARRMFRLCTQSQWNYSRAKEQLAHGTWRNKIIPIQNRPFDVRYTVYDSNVAVHRRERVMNHMLAGDNLGLGTTRSIEIGRGWEHIFCSADIIQHHTVSIKEVNYLFPLYLYPTQGQMSLGEGETGKRRANLNPEFVEEMASKVGLRYVGDGKGDLEGTFGPEDVFDYMYAVFHSPTYRSRYAEFLKIDFPRVPVTSEVGLFRVLCGMGARLVELHLMEDGGKRETRNVRRETRNAKREDGQDVAVSYPVGGSHLVEQVRYSGPGEGSEKGRVWINKEQYFEGVPQEVWDFHVGGYKVAEKWLKDRKARVLNSDDREHYKSIVRALWETGRIMQEIDEAIGEWPIH